MIDDYIYFVPGVEAVENESDMDLWFIFNNNRLMIKNIDNKVEITTADSIKKVRNHLKYENYLGKYRGIKCYTAEIQNLDMIEDGFKFEDLRVVAQIAEEEIFLLCSRAVQVINWEKDHRFCGRCGTAMENRIGERAKKCPKCGLLNYPRISPAIIVAVTRGEKLLLAHNKNFKGDLYSVIAGFVDPGETFEQCVKREVLEETNIKVKNIRYFQSQPWPFPNSLMIAFTAEYDGGEIKVDEVEIEHAAWYGADELPQIPLRGTVARNLIDWFLKENKYKNLKE